MWVVWNIFLLLCCHGPCGPISSLHPWYNWIPPDHHGFYRWVFDSVELLKDFLKQVVVSRRDLGIRKWDRPYAWLRPDFVPPSLPLSRCQGSSDWVISYFG